MMNSRWRENPEGAFRELKKRGMVVTIKTEGNASQTRQLAGFANINANGMPTKQETKTSVFTCRQHGEFNNEKNDLLRQSLLANQLSVNEWRQASIQSRGKTLTS
jgi:hypothetical protein